MPDAISTRRPSVLRLLTIITAVLLVTMIPKIRIWIPQEISRWYLAGAMEHDLEQDPARAEELADRALHWDPQSYAALLFSADLAAQQNRPWESLDDIRSLHAVYPTSLDSLTSRATAYQLLEQHQLAIEDWNSVLAITQAKLKQFRSPRAVWGSQLNGAAYARAVANRELDRALQQANLAVDSAGGEIFVFDPQGLEEFNRCLIATARAEAAYFGQPKLYRLALQIADRLVGHAERRFEQLRQSARQAARQGRGFRVASLQDYRAFVAACYLQRAQIHDVLGQREQAASDREVILQRLKLKPTEVKKPNLDAQAAFGSLAAYLDTRGWVYYQLNRPADALQDLNGAIRMYARFQSVLNRVDGKKVGTDIRRYQKRDGQMKRSMAVTLYHRAKTHQKIGATKAAEKDFAAVKKLGFEPSDKLF